MHICTMVGTLQPYGLSVIKHLFERPVDVERDDVFGCPDVPSSDKNTQGLMSRAHAGPAPFHGLRGPYRAHEPSD